MTYRERELPERSVVLRTTEEPVVCVADLLLHHPFVPLGRQVLRWVETRSQRQSQSMRWKVEGATGGSCEDPASQ